MNLTPDQDVKNQFLSIRGKVGTENEIGLDEDVTVTVTVNEISDKSNNDGTVDRTYRAVLFVADEFDGKKIKLKPGKMTPSQEMRWLLNRYWKEKTDQSIPFDLYYTRIMRKKNDEILEKLN